MIVSVRATSSPPLRPRLARRAARVLLGLAVLAALPACDPDLEPTDAGQYALELSLADFLGQDSQRVLVGTRFEARLAGLHGDAAAQIELGSGDLACVTASASGSLTQLATSVDELGGTYEVSEAGPGAIELAAPGVACPDAANLDALGPDRWSLIGVAPEQVVGAWVQPEEGLVLDGGYSAGPQGQFPPGFGAPMDLLRVAAGSRFRAVPTLLDPEVDAASEVRWSSSDAHVAVPEGYENLVTSRDENGDLVEGIAVRGSLPADERVSAQLVVAGAEIELPELRSVPAEQIVSLEIVPVYVAVDEEDADQRDWGPPIGVSVIARDAEGRRILGAPLERSVTAGRLLFGQLDEVDVGDSFTVRSCEAAPTGPTRREATIEVRLADLVASTELEWIALPRDGDPDDDPNCSEPASCTCSTDLGVGGGPGESGLAGLALLGLGLWLRRRRPA